MRIRTVQKHAEPCASGSETLVTTYMSHAYFDDRYTSKDGETKKNMRKVNYQEKLNISEVFHLEVAAS
ncbi:MAG TPA: hypothetical protein DDE71_01445 [Tenacibaculum sp.]|nr:hypothetical protein [Tenacibaculum sp.]